MNKFFIITGASGSGKTEVLNLLKERFEGTKKSISFLHFDSIGVPDTDEMIKLHGSPEEWQRMKTDEWVKCLSELSYSYDYIFLEGQMRISFIQKALHKYNLTAAKIILLDCSDQVRKTRLNQNRNQPDLADDQMMAWAKYLRNEAKKKRIATIDTTLLSTLEVADNILKITDSANK